MKDRMKYDEDLTEISEFQIFLFVACHTLSFMKCDCVSVTVVSFLSYMDVWVICCWGILFCSSFLAVSQCFLLTLCAGKRFLIFFCIFIKNINITIYYSSCCCCCCCGGLYINKEKKMVELLLVFVWEGFCKNLKNPLLIYNQFHFQ